MPIYVGNSGSYKILGMTKSSSDQQNIKDDTIFHSSLPYVRVVEHELTSFSYVNSKCYIQPYNSTYWNQVAEDGVSSIWWCGQLFTLTAQLQNMLQNTTQGFMIFIQWSDGWWEPFTPLGFEHDRLFTWDNSSNFSMTDTLAVTDYFRNSYGMSKYSTGLFIPRRKINGQNKFDSQAYVTKVRILELVGLNVSTTGAVTLTPQNPQQTNQIYIDNTRFQIGSLDIMQQRYLQLMTNVTTAAQTTKVHNVQCDMIYPASYSYNMSTMDQVSNNRVAGLAGRYPRNAPPIVYSEGSTSAPTWDVISYYLQPILVTSLTNSWTRMLPRAQAWMGGVYVPRLGQPTNQASTITQSQSYRRDDFISRSMPTAQLGGSQLMQVGVLSGDKFGTGVVMDARVPSINRGGRQLFSPTTQGVSRVGPTRTFTVPRECLIVYYYKGSTNTITQFHNKTILTTITLTQQESISEYFLVTFQQGFNPEGTANTSVNTQVITYPPYPQTGTAFYKTKRSTQDAEVGYTIQGQTVSSANPWVMAQASYNGPMRSSESSRQVHQIYLQPGSKYIIDENEVAVISGTTGTYKAEVGIIHYLERVGNNIQLVSETYQNQNYSDVETGFIGLPEGVFSGGYKLGLTQVL